MADADASAPSRAAVSLGDVGLEGGELVSFLGPGAFGGFPTWGRGRGCAGTLIASERLACRRLPAFSSSRRTK
jgi:hypothetical protein